MVFVTKLKDCCEDEDYIRTFASQMLKGRTFAGSLQQHSYVESLDKRVAVVEVAKTEEKLAHDLQVVKRRLSNYFGATYWTGITQPDTVGAPAKHCIWGVINNQTFGDGCFTIKDIDIDSNNVVFRIESHIVHRSPTVATPNGTREQLRIVSNAVPQFALYFHYCWTLFHTYFSLVRTHMVLPNWLTLPNVIEAIRFICVLITTIIMTMAYVIGQSSDFLLKVLDRLGNIIQTLTPIIMGVLDLIRFIVQGFYWTISSMWRSAVHKEPQPIYQLHVNQRDLPKMLPSQTTRSISWR